MNGLTLSHNELRALLSRTCESLFGQTQDVKAIAETVLWLEASGLGGVSHTVRALPVLSANYNRPKLSWPKSGIIEFDGHGQSLFLFADIIADLTCSLAIRIGHGRVDIEGVKDPSVILRAVMLCAKDGCYAMAEWAGGAALGTPDRAEPDMQGVFAHTEKLSLICSQKPMALEKGTALTLSADTLMAAYEQSLDKGININRSDYDVLCEVADQVLVPDSDISRKGAGD